MAIKHSLKFVKPNRYTFKASFDSVARTWTDPIDGQIYSVAHLNAFFVDISYAKDNVLRKVRARVSFSPHCYTREKKWQDDDESIVVSERTSKRVVDRVFDHERWNYSLSLLELMQGVESLNCKRDDDNQVVIHLAPRNVCRPGEGWYTFIRVQVDPKFPDILQLEVRTTHRRNGHPAASRYPIRFNQHLANLLDE